MDFYSNESHTILFKSIPRQNIIEINKRQITIDDLFKFSIYYTTLDSSNTIKIKVFHIKGFNNTETDNWVAILRRVIDPKKFYYQTEENSTFKGTNQSYSYSDLKNFYTILSHIEYIFARRQFKQFFEYYKNSTNKIEYTETKEENISTSCLINDREKRINTPNSQIPISNKITENDYSN